MIDKVTRCLRGLLPAKVYAFLSLCVARSLGFVLNAFRIGLTRLRLLGRGHKPRVFLLDLATHRNIGDGALGVAEQHFLSECYPEYELIYAPEITLSLSGEWGPKHWAHLYRKGDVLWLHGGGNLGSRYLYCDQTRRALIRFFPSAPKSTFPLSVSMAAGEDPTAYLQKAAQAYRDASRLTVFLRDPLSRDMVNQWFSGVDARLSPDIVFSLARWYQTVTFERKGIYFCMRHDGERHYGQGDMDAMESALAQAGFGVVHGDTQHSGKLTARNRERIVLQTIEKHGKYLAVVTDRLHGLVFSVLARTPCVVLRTKDHKLIGAYETVKAWPYVRLAENPDEAVRLGKELACVNHSAMEPFMPDMSALMEAVTLSREDAKREGRL